MTRKLVRTTFHPPLRYYVGAPAHYADILNSIKVSVTFPGVNVTANDYAFVQGTHHIAGSIVELVVNSGEATNLAVDNRDGKIVPGGESISRIGNAIISALRHPAMVASKAMASKHKFVAAIAGRPPAPPSYDHMIPWWVDQIQ